MSAQTEVDVSAEVETEARSMGWVPQEEFRGDKSKWIEASTFVERGKEFIPFLRKSNEGLIRELNSLRLQVNQQAQRLEASQKDFDNLQDMQNEEIVRRVEETKLDLRKQIKQAARDGEHEQVADLQEQLTELTVAQKAAEPAVNGKQVAGNVDTGQQPALSPEFLAWKSANPWFDTDPDKTDEAMIVGARIKRENPDLIGRAFLSELDKRLAERAPRSRTSKVEGSRGGSTQSSSAGRTYADLPAEAKAACDKYAKKFVNPNGRFKTIADYRLHYVKQLEETGAL